ncbi:MAG: DUF2974 domain-containing protein [Lachnospiraceae bacterium]|nr:DUF2974 domain-containing protein [Lachnospiraceae bacterium]
MAETILDYLERYGELTLWDFPLNDVDGLILCQLSYLKFDGLVPNVKEIAKSVTLRQIAEHTDYENLYGDTRYEKDNRALFEGVLNSRRFGNMKLNCYINIIEKEWETQFSAITMLLEDGTAFVAFRGTDETIVGWKEDFNMAFLSPVPGQTYSAKYLNVVTTRLHGSFYVGGHSKGGNLAIYSAMNCAPRVQERIQRIYSMDGPGFRPEVLEECGYSNIADKVVKLVPVSSLVGMLFEWDTRYRVIQSKVPGLAQHNPYTWLVKDGHFQEKDEIRNSRMVLDVAINEWLLKLDETQIKEFVNALFQVLEASQADDLITFTSDWRKSMNGMIVALKETDEHTKEMVKTIVKALFESYGNHVKDEVNVGINHVGTRVKSAKHISKT